MDNTEPTSFANEQSPPNEQTAHADTMQMLEDARAKADEHWNQVLRMRADLENLRRRHERDLENAHKYALERFVQELLPVKDSLEMGLAASGAAAAEELARLREGMELTHKMLHAALEKFGVKEINPQGEKFNPALHQAMSMQEAAHVEPNTVITVAQKGYTLHDRLIRPARVIVAQPPSAA
ncbi:MAG: nucleotide exchange factor GrpE [Pseudomonadota bacterium]